MSRGPQPRTDIDWEAIQREYRAGVFSTLEIAKQYNVSHTLINRRAKKHPEQWKRDLTKRVKQAINQRIVSETIADDTVSTIGTEDAIIEAAADRAIGIIRKHQASIGRTALVEAELLAELQGEKAKEGSVVGRLGGFHAFVSAQEKRIRMERQAFGITDDKSPGAEQITVIPIIFDGED